MSRLLRADTPATSIAQAEAPVPRDLGPSSLVRQRRSLHAVLVVVDAVALALAFWLAYGIRFHSGWPVFRTDVAADAPLYVQIVAVLIPVWLGVFWVAGLYRDHNLLGGTREYSLVFNAVSTGFLAVVMVTFLVPEFVVARAWLLAAWFLAFVGVSAGRFTVRRIVYALRARGCFLARALLVGTNDEAMALADQLLGWRTSGLRLIGCVGAQPPCSDGIDLAYLGTVDDVERIVDGLGVAEVVVAASDVTRPQLVDLFRRIAHREHVQLRLSSGLFELVTTGLEIKELAYVPLINVRPARLFGMDVALKAGLDYPLALLALAASAPLWLLLSVLITLDSPGPVLHRRRVLGMGGREFDALKFRTMVMDGDAVLANHPALAAELAEHVKLRNDPRVTRVGRWLRRTSLDELPQLLNVLAGQMSIVGPRMITPAEHSRYGQWDLNLLTVKPGLTGLWQVSGRADLDYDERVRLDMNYIRNWTIWLDLQILWQTVPAILRRRGAY